MNIQHHINMIKQIRAEELRFTLTQFFYPRLLRQSCKAVTHHGKSYHYKLVNKSNHVRQHMNIPNFI